MCLKKFLYNLRARRQIANATNYNLYFVVQINRNISGLLNLTWITIRNPNKKHSKIREFFWII